MQSVSRRASSTTLHSLLVTESMQVRQTVLDFNSTSANTSTTQFMIDATMYSTETQITVDQTGTVKSTSQIMVDQTGTVTVTSTTQVDETGTVTSTTQVDPSDTTTSTSQTMAQPDSSASGAVLGASVASGLLVVVLTVVAIILIIGLVARRKTKHSSFIVTQPNILYGGVFKAAQTENEATYMETITSDESEALGEVNTELPCSDNVAYGEGQIKDTRYEFTENVSYASTHIPDQRNARFDAADRDPCADGGAYNLEMTEVKGNTDHDYTTIDDYDYVQQ